MDWNGFKTAEERNRENLKYECSDCGEKKRLLWGICTVCGGDVIEGEREDTNEGV